MNERPARTRGMLMKVVSAVFGVLIIWFIYDRLAPDISRLSWAEVIAQRPAVGPLLMSLVILLAAQLLHAFLWRRIAVDLGSPTASARSVLHIYFVSSLARYVPGKVWQIAGVAVLAARFGMAAGRAVAASIIAQVVFLATGLVMVGAALPDLAGTLHADSTIARIDPLLSGMLILAMCGVAVWVVARTPAGDAMRRLLLRLAGPNVGARLGNAVAVAEDITALNAATWVLGYAFSWLLVCGAFVVFVGSFEPVAFARPLLVGGVLAAAYLGGLLVPFVPAGAGARELIMLALLGSIMSAPAAVTISIMSRLWFTASELLPLALIPIASTTTRSGPSTGREGSTLPGII